MIEDHSSCIRVSDTKICCSCYSKHIIKNGTTKQENNSISAKTAIKDL